MSYIVLYRKGGYLQLEDFPSFKSALYWQKKYGGYIVEDIDFDEPMAPSDIPPASVGK